MKTGHVKRFTAKPTTNTCTLTGIVPSRKEREWKFTMMSAEKHFNAKKCPQKLQADVKNIKITF